MTANRLLTIVFFVLGFLSFNSTAFAEPEINAEAAILIDVKNKQVLLEKNADTRMYPASTTKIITAMIAIEKGKLDDIVTVSREACLAGGSAIGLQEGEKLPLKELLYAMLLSSANDAAVAVAEHIGGSVQEFAGMMNTEARRLGATGTNFVNPHGMPDENHYTTARDMAIITMSAMSSPVFREIVSTYHYRTERSLPEPVDGIPQVDFVNTNRLLWNSSSFAYEGTTGIKTGYTSEAGNCLVYSVKRGERELLGVLLKCQAFEMYREAASLGDYCFANFVPVELVKEGQEMARVRIKEGVAKDVGVLAAKTYYFNYPANKNVHVDQEINVKSEITAPVEQGDRLGEIVFSVDGKPLGSTDLVAAAKIEKKVMVWPWFSGLFLGVVFTVRWANKSRSAKRKWHHGRRYR